MENTHLKKKYGLPTAISLVVGIVIGSGIFFKADDVLIKTDLNPTLGIIGFLIIGLGVVCGALLIAQFAIHYKSEEGGVVGYARFTHSKVFGRLYGFATGWFLVSIYFPALIVILAFVCQLYLVQFLNISVNVTQSLLITGLLIVLVYLTNTFIPKICGGIQTAATITKLIPLILIAIFGMFIAGSSQEITDSGVGLVSANLDNVSNNFLTALISIAFTFDGWYIATSISGELSDAKKKLPIALVGGTIVITIVYIIYYFGITHLIDPTTIVEAGDGHIEIAGYILFDKIGLGALGGKIILAFVVISVYGGLNGMVLSYMRIPHALVDNGLMKDPIDIKKVNEKIDMPVNSILVGLFFVIVFFVVQAVILNLPADNTYASFDISTLPIVILYIFFIIMYTGISKLIKQKVTPSFYYIIMIVAIIINLLAIFGTLVSFEQDGSMYINTLGVSYVIIGLIVTIIGFLLYKKEEA